MEKSAESVLLTPEAWDPACTLGSRGSVKMAVLGADGSLDLRDEY